MNKLLLLYVLLMLPAGVSAQTLEFCEKGFVCWTDASGGKAATNLKIDSENKRMAITVPPGITRYHFAESYSDPTSLWICTQNQHAYPDGTVSRWYVSETEGICKAMADVLPPIIEPPPIEPPPIEPPPIVVKPGEVSSVRISARVGTQVELTWSATDGAISYSVKYITSKGTLSTIIKGVKATIALVGLPTSGRRYYVVCAVNSAGETCPAKLQGAFATR